MASKLTIFQSCPTLDVGYYNYDRTPAKNGWGFCIYGASMLTSTIEKVDLSDIDEALTHLSLVPTSERGAAWVAFMDAVLEQRRELEK